MSAEESRLQLKGALEECVLVSEQSDNEGEKSENDDGSQHEQGQAQ